MRAYGSTGTPLAGHHNDKDDQFAGLRTRPWGRSITDHLEKAHARRSPLPELAPLTPAQERALAAAPTASPRPKESKTARRPRPAKAPRAQSRRATSAFRETAIARYQAGQTITAIARDLGISRAHTHRIIRDSGIPMRDDRKARHGGLKSRANVPLIVELYTAGHSLAEVGRRVDMAPNTIRYHLLQAGVQLRGQHDPTKEKRREHVAGLYRAGWTVPRICEALDLSETVVRRDLEIAGVPRRDDRVNNGRRTA